MGVPPDSLRGGTPNRGRPRWEGAPGDTMTIIGACRDTFRVLRAEPGGQSEELKPALDEVEIRQRARWILTGPEKQVLTPV